jgi:hypothetical protein
MTAPTVTLWTAPLPLQAEQTVADARRLYDAELQALKAKLPKQTT